MRRLAPPPKAAPLTVREGDLACPLDGASQLRDSAGFSPDFASNTGPGSTPSTRQRTSEQRPVTSCPVARAARSQVDQ